MVGGFLYMTLVDGINALYRAHVLAGNIQLQDDGEGPYIKVWNAEAVGISQAIGEERIAAHNSLTLTKVGSYQVQCNSATVAGKNVQVQLFKDGVVVATDTAVVNGNIASDTFLVPAGPYKVRFFVNEHPFASGELEVTF
jgi:hypothetical protein